jgi:hypothetical protein
MGDGSMTLPDTFDRFDDILDILNEVGSLVRIREDDTGSVVAEWIPSSISPVAAKGDPFVQVSGHSINEIMEYAIAEAWDWDGSAEWRSLVPDWTWGGDNLISNPGFEDGTITVTKYILNITATGGDFTLSDGTDTTDPIGTPFNDAAGAITNAIENDIAALPDVVVDRTSIANPTYLIQYVTPPFGPVLTVDPSGLTGGTATIALEEGGRVSPRPWTIAHNFAESTPPDDAYPFFGVVTTSPDTGSRALLVDPPSPGVISNRQPGAQVVFNVTPGQLLQISARVRPNSAADHFRWRLVTNGEEIIAQDDAFLTANVYQTISLPDVIVPAGITEVAFRIQQINAHPHNPSPWRLDNVLINEGLIATTVGEIMRVLYEDATVDHVADGRLVWENEASPGNPYLTLDFSDTLDSSGAAWANDEISIQFPMRMTYLQILEALESQEAIEWRVVPNNVETGTWFLQVYDEGNMDDAPNIAIQGGSHDTRRVLRRMRPDSAFMVEGEDLVTGRAESVSGFGRIESARLDRTVVGGAAVTAATQDRNNSLLINDVWSYELTDPPQDAPLYHYRVGDTVFVHDPPDVNDDGRVWEVNAVFSADRVTWNVDIIKPGAIEE